MFMRQLPIPLEGDSHQVRREQRRNAALLGPLLQERKPRLTMLVMG
jgi:hypothetical protein